MMEIVVRFLGDRYVARRSDETSRSEWPPSPDRLYQALTNAAHRLQSQEETLRAREWLEWLATLDAPVISAARGHEGVALHQRFDVRSVVTRQQRSGKSVQLINQRQDIVNVVDTPLADPVVVFRYLAELPAKFAAISGATAAAIGYLGASESPVVVTLGPTAQREAHVRYVPHEHGDIALPVPYPGRLGDLDAMIDGFRRKGRPVWQPYTRISAALVQYAIEDDLATIPEILGEFGQIVTLAFKRQSALIDSLDFLPFVNGVRRAYLSQLPEGAHGLLTGHDHRSKDGAWPGPHAAFVPLFDAGFPYASSRLRGVGLVLPREIDTVLRREALHAFNIDHVMVRGTRYELEHRPAAEGELQALRVGRYGARDRYWTTLTPIRLWKMPDRHGRDIPELVAQTISQAGYPTPDSIETSPAPFVQGGRHAGAFRDAFEKPYWLVHARFCFTRPVRGPMLLGRGRHVGFGLCAPDPSPRERAA